MLLDDLPGADLGGLGHGDLVVHPGGHDHPGRAVLKLAHGPLDHVAHAVDETHREGGPAVQGDIHRFLGNELGLRRHDGPAAAGLGQLVDGPFPAVDVVDVGDDARLHEALDKGGLPCSDRTKHPYEQGAAGPCGNILIEIRICHSYLPCAAGAFFSNLRAWEVFVLLL